MYRIGLDLGSSYTKGVLVDGSGRIIDRVVTKTGYNFPNAAKSVIDQLSKDRKIEYPIHSCGYGREELDVPFVATSEIITLARAVFEKYKRKTIILDIGGQDTKYIKITETGLVDKFKLNRKCAAGTGSFLEEIAFRLGIPPEDFNELASKATEEIKINSFCTVFAISEIIGMIKKKVSLPNIVLGIYNGILERAIELASLEQSLVLTGGIPAKHPMIIQLFKRHFPNVESPDEAQFMAAYGCTLANPTCAIRGAKNFF